MANMQTLAEIADQAMIDRGFISEYPQPVVQAVNALSEKDAICSFSAPKEMSDRLWFSIDNDDSLDLDQLTYAETTPNGKNKIYIAIADVSALVKKNSPIDLYAGHNTTSVYTPTKIFHMLPPKLSTDLTSLNEKAERCAVVVEMDIGNDGSFEISDIYPARVYNHAKLTYNRVADWMQKKVKQPYANGPIAGLQEQLTLQDALAKKIRDFRNQQGNLTFSTIEMRAIITDGIPTGIQQTTHNRANSLIENFMIAANVGMTRYLESKGLPIIKRIVRVPKKWDRIVELAKEKGEKLPSEPNGKALRDFLLKQRRQDPVHFPDLSLAMIKLIGRGEYIVAIPGEPSPGHFDLALQDYAHTTAPNRRYSDLIIQRLLKSHFDRTAPAYSVEELTAIAKQCTEKEDDAVKVERRVNKSAAAMVLSNQIGTIYPAIVTGKTEKGTWVRLKTLPLEGKLVHGFDRIDVGDSVSVKLIHVDVAKGHIDFAAV